ncbi:MAG: hypothetical protein JW797_00525 [Bradymonadales bacterium]|nr:hypothetical protein [Bradymonadales bacterium]
MKKYNPPVPALALADGGQNAQVSSYTGAGCQYQTGYRCNLETESKDEPGEGGASDQDCPGPDGHLLTT